MTDRKKRCTRCGKWKPLDAFGVRRSRGEDADGRYEPEPACRPCDRRRQRDRYHADPEAARARQRARARARSRAYVRLTHHYPELFEQLLADELDKEPATRE